MTRATLRPFSPPIVRARAAAPAAALALVTFLGLDAPAARAAEKTPLTVCATVPDLADIARQIGGETVAVTSFTRGPQDAHFLDARPSFVRLLNKADLFIEVGMDLEVGWAPALLRAARNPRVIAGAPGFLDASTHIERLYPLGKRTSRSMGDVHPFGNPHYLLDPLDGLRVAQDVAAALTALEPEMEADIQKRFVAFRRRVATALLGERLLGKYGAADVSKLLALLRRGGLDRFLAFLDKQKQADLLGGWLGAMRPFRGAKLIADHNLWPYFARRFGVRLAGFLEPKPGISPTTRHLAKVIKQMRVEKIRVILSAPYFDVRHAKFVAARTGATIAPMAHQVGGRPGTDTYIEMIDYNIKQIVKALRK